MAGELVEFVDAGENYRAKSESYRKTKCWKDMWWLEGHMLHGGMTASETRAIFGEPEFSSGAFEAYRGEVPESAGTYVWLYYRDGSLESWGHGNAPPEALAGMRELLVKDR
jgi:hypothetical protein